MSNKVSWLSYEFDVYDSKAQWNNVPGIYIFCGLNANNRWVAYYIGQTISFRDRLANHEDWPSAVRLGATHIHARVVLLQSDRDKVEAQLIQYYKPHLNVQLK